MTLVLDNYDSFTFGQPAGKAPRTVPRAISAPTLTRISHTHGPKCTPGNRNLLTRKTVTREARVPADLTACRMGNTDFQLVAVKAQVSQVRHHARWRRRSGNADLRSAQRPAGPRAVHCRPPSRGAGMGPAALRTVSAIPMYGSRRTLGFPPRRNHLGTGGPSRRPPTAGCADRRSAFPCLRVVPPGGLGAMRHVQRPRGAFCDSASAPEYEKCGLTICSGCGAHSPRADGAQRSALRTIVSGGEGKPLPAPLPRGALRRERTQDDSR